MRYTITGTGEMVIIFGSGSNDLSCPSRQAPGMNGHLVPGDRAFHDDNEVIADLVSLNELLGRYVLRVLAVDALRADPISVTEERALAETMSAGRVLTSSSDCRSASVTESCSRTNTVWGRSPLACSWAAPTDLRISYRRVCSDLTFLRTYNLF